MKLNLELPKSSAWEEASPQQNLATSSNSNDFWSGSYNNALDWLNALSLHIAEEAALKRNLPTASLNGFPTDRRTIGLFQSKREVDESFRFFIHSPQKATEKLISLFRYVYHCDEMHRKSINIYTFWDDDRLYSVYNGWRGVEDYSIRP